MIPFAIPAIALRWWKLAAGIVLGALLCWPVASCEGRKDGRAEMRAGIYKATLNAARRNASANEASAERQAIDTRTVNDMEGAYRDAIGNTVDSRPDDASRALGCQRLRRARPGAELPEGC